MLKRDLEKDNEALVQENQLLREVAADLQWVAQRYADGRQSYVTSLFNRHTRTLLSLGVELNPGGEGTIWARDAMGRAFDGLTDAEADTGDRVPEWLLPLTNDTLTLRALIRDLAVRLDIAGVGESQLIEETKRVLEAEPQPTELWLGWKRQQNISTTFWGVFASVGAVKKKLEAGHDERELHWTQNNREWRAGLKRSRITLIAERVPVEL